MAKQTTVWDELSDLVTSDEGKRELGTLRSTYLEISQKLASLAQVGAATATRGSQGGMGALPQAVAGSGARALGGLAAAHN